MALDKDLILKSVDRHVRDTFLKRRKDEMEKKKGHKSKMDKNMRRYRNYIAFY